MASKVVQYFRLLRDAGSEFSDDNGTKLSASLAYATIFSIGPFLLVIITLAGIFFNPADVTAKIQSQMSGLVGAGGADTIISIFTKIRAQENKTLFGIIGVIVLVFGATSIFTEIQSSINYIWSIRAKPKKGWLKFVKDRVLSFSLIVGLGFLLIVTLFANILMDLLTARLATFLGNINVLLIKGVNVLALFCITTFLFTVIYKVLPDARIKSKDAVVGSCFTSILFLIGKFLIGYYLGNSKLSSSYGAAASIIILLSWIYYSAMILYFGAEFTKVYALQKGSGIQPYKTAVFILKREAKEAPAPPPDEELPLQ